MVRWTTWTEQRIVYIHVCLFRHTQTGNEAGFLAFIIQPAAK